MIELQTLMDVRGKKLYNSIFTAVNDDEIKHTFYWSCMRIKTVCSKKLFEYVSEKLTKAFRQKWKVFFTQSLGGIFSYHLSSFLQFWLRRREYLQLVVNILTIHQTILSNLRLMKVLLLMRLTLHLVSIMKTIFPYTKRLFVPMSFFHGLISTKFCADLHANPGKVLNTTMTPPTWSPDPRVSQTPKP